MRQLIVKCAAALVVAWLFAVFVVFASHSVIYLERKMFSQPNSHMTPCMQERFRYKS